MNIYRFNCVVRSAKDRRAVKRVTYDQLAMSVTDAFDKVEAYFAKSHYEKVSLSWAIVNPSNYDMFQNDWLNGDGE